MVDFFVELSLVMVLVLLISFVMNKIKQPLLIGYIIAGLIAGPLFLNILSSSDGYETFSNIGISLLLFIVGLHLNLRLIKEVGIISLITGIGQIIFTSLIGFFIAYILGYGLIAAILIAIALTFSSTIIIVKLLSDKKDLNTLYGKISMGFLIVQDLVAVVLLMIISAFLSSNTVEGESILGMMFLKTLLLIFVSIVATYFLSKNVLPNLLNYISKSTELLFIFVISWCLSIAALFHYLGFSIEVGALLAGVALASSPYQFEISSKIRPLRDFFIVMFFILLGSHMLPSIENIDNVSFFEKLNLVKETFAPIFLPALILSLFVLIGNPLIVLVLMTRRGYSSKIGCYAGLTVAQISEFSLILAMLGTEAGFLSIEELSMVTLVGIITITFSTYMILNSSYLYKKFEFFLKKFEKKEIKEKASDLNIHTYEIIILGYDKLGYSLIKTIKKMKKSYIVIDYDPEIIKKLKSKGINCIYGDVSNVEFISEFNLDNLKLLISTIPEHEINLLLLKYLKKNNLNSFFMLTSNTIEHALDLYNEGSDYVILPHFIGGEHVSIIIETNYENFNNLLRDKIEHINELKKRKNYKNEVNKT